MTPTEVRSLFPILRERAYLFSGGIAPTNSRGLEALQQHLDRVGSDAARLYADDLLSDYHEARRLFASLVGADVDEIAVVGSTSEGTSIAVDIIEVAEGSNVVFDEWSYASTVYPFLLPARDRLQKRFVPPRDGRVLLEDLAAAIDDNTVAVGVSHVTPAQGFRQDIGELARIAHAHGALLLVDGAQAAGAMRIDLHALDVDFYSCCAMKWLLGAAGVAFLYVARRHLARTPSRAGWASNREGFDIHRFALHETAERFQLGMPNLMGLAYTRPGLEILLQVGMDVVERHVLDLSGYCIEGMRDRGLQVLTPEDRRCRLGVIAAVVPDADRLWHLLHARGVDTYRHGSLFRVDPHVFNTRQDVDRLLEGIDAFVSSR